MRKVRERISEDDYYLNIAAEVARRSTCLRRHYGAVIVRNKQIISTGYCGSPRGTVNCSDMGLCLREEMDIKRGKNYELCRAVHAEQNAIIHAPRLDMLGSTLYLVGMDASNGRVLDDSMPCLICRRMIINAGIAEVIIRRGDRIRLEKISEWIKSNLGEVKKTETGEFAPMVPEDYE
jgi:dCMP deaminase